MKPHGHARRPPRMATVVRSSGAMSAKQKMSPRQEAKYMSPPVSPPITCLGADDGGRTCREQRERERQRLDAASRARPCPAFRCRPRVPARASMKVPPMAPALAVRVSTPLASAVQGLFEKTAGREREIADEDEAEAAHFEKPGAPQVVAALEDQCRREAAPESEPLHDGELRAVEPGAIGPDVKASAMAEARPKRRGSR